jgi:hypothetical protein
MRFSVLIPSPMEAKVLEERSEGKLIVLQPVRYARSQTKLYVLPVEVHTDSGEVLLDRVFMTVNANTGKISIERRMEEIESPVDEVSGKAKPPASRRSAGDVLGDT